MTDLFEARARDWDASERRTRMAAAIGASILDRLPLDKGMSVLDFGAGTGLLTARIAPRVARMVAVDTSPAMLEKLAAKPELGEQVEIVCRDIVKEPLAERFDAIVSAMTLHHVENTMQLMQGFAAQLNEGGAVALADLDKEDGSFHPPETEGVYHFGFERDALRALMENCGFRDVSFITAHTIVGEKRNYPIFLVTARKA